MPICLPGSELFPDEEGQVYVAGWGLNADKYDTSGKYGPDPYTLCAPIFKFNNKTHSGCVNISSPSSSDTLCKKLIKSKNLTSIPEAGYTQTDIFNGKDNLLTTCYNFPINNKRYHGWCSTCQKQARPGQPGYCGLNPFRIKEEQGIPTATKGWGYCEKPGPPYFPDDQALLKEVQLELLSVKECKMMGNSLNVLTDIELCAAKQVNRISLDFYNFPNKI